MTYDYTQHAPRGGGSYVKWDRQGMRLEGVVVTVGTGRDFDGNPVPELKVRDASGGEHIVSCAQTILHDKIIELQPQPGDQIVIDHTGMAGQAKNFEVTVTKPTQAPVQQAGPAPVAVTQTAPAQGIAPPPLGQAAPPLS